MRHAVAMAAGAVIVAVALVLVVAEEEAGEDTTTGTATETTAEPPRTETTSEPPAGEDESGDAAQVERAVALYVEAAERGEHPAEGLPTTDELSIRDVRVEGNRATVRLAGGARLSLRRVGGSWQVQRVRPARTPPPSPPSDG